jgi:D-alanyl-D-alanine carboxypeptidase
LGIGFDHGWLGHTGELPGYNTAAFYLPAQDATMVIEVNSDIPGPNDKDPAPALFRALTTIVTPNNIGG